MLSELNIKGLLALVVMGAATATASGSPSAGAQASHLIDRTVICATTRLGGVREVEVRAHAGIRRGSSGWKQLPFAVVSSGAVGSRLTALDNSLAWITAGRPSGTTTMDTGFNLSWPHTSGTLALNRRTCRASAASIPLTSKGLEGGPAGVFGDDFDCSNVRRVLVRVQALLQSPAKLQAVSRFLRTNTPVRQARMAMRTESGKPLVFAEVFDSGKARVFTARSCFPG